MKIRGSHVTALAVLAGVGVWMGTGTLTVGGQGGGSTVMERAAGPSSDAPVRVRAQESAAVERIPTLVVRGRTEAESRVEVRAETAGVVRSRAVRKGDRVEQGALLCTLDRGTRETRLLQARAQLAQAEFDYQAANELRSRGNAPEARVQALLAQREAARAAVADAELDVARTEIRAPVAGIAQDPIAEVGAWLRIADTCVTLVDTDPILAVGQVSERDIGALATGMPARVTLVDGGTVEGRLRFIAPSADAATRTFRVEVEAPNRDHRVRDGITTEILIALPAQRSHLVPPSYLALADDGRVGVKVVDAGGRAAFVPVRILAQNREGVFVGGLPDRVTIITVGHEYVRPGARVEVTLVTAEVR